MNEHFNRVKNRYRYKKINLKTQKLIGFHFTPTDLGYSTNQLSNSIRCVLVRYDYKPYWFFKIIWSLIIWYKRPKLKTIKKYPIISIASKFMFIVIIPAIIGLIIGILLLIYRDNIISFFN